MYDWHFTVMWVKCSRQVQDNTSKCREFDNIPIPTQHFWHIIHGKIFWDWMLTKTQIIVSYHIKSILCIIHTTSQTLCSFLIMPVRNDSRHFPHNPSKKFWNDTCRIYDYKMENLKGNDQNNSKYYSQIFSGSKIDALAARLFPYMEVIKNERFWTNIFTEHCTTLIGAMAGFEISFNDSTDWSQPVSFGVYTIAEVRFRVMICQ